MSDQPLDPGQQPSGQQIDWEARYKGTGPIINQLTQKSEALQAQVSQLTSELEQLKAQLALKETEKTVALGERDKQINDLVSAASQNDTELKRLRGVDRKLKVAKDLNAPQLLTVLETIPDLESDEALTSVMKNLMDWSASQVKEREQQLLAGYTGGGAPAPVTSVSLPTNIEGWQRYLNEASDGTPEKSARFKQFRDWGASQK